jgi:hypothetical protein
MRILSQNLVLLGRRGLRGAGLLGVAAACGSCAKFPSNSAGNFTAITFTFQVAGTINTTAPYIYDVAIAASPLSPPNTTYAPLPVINSSNPNGRVSGSPTHFVEFNSLNPNSPLPFTLYRFALSTEIPNPNDPTNPINLAHWAPSTRGQIFNFSTPQTGGDPSTLSFTVYTNELADTDAEAQQLQSLQVNILTMTRLANVGSSQRIIDALGNSSTVSGLNQFLVVDLRYNSTYSNVQMQLEPTGDTFNGTEPDVDISNFTITVQRP